MRNPSETEITRFQENTQRYRLIPVDMTKFYLENRPNKAGLYPVRVAVTFKGIRFISQAGISVNAKQWDKAAGAPKKSYSDVEGKTAATVSASLSQLAAYFDTLTARAEQKGETLSVPDLREALNIYKGKDTKKAAAPGIFSKLDEFTADSSRAKLWADKTAENYTALRSALYSFSPALNFSELDERKVKDFLSFLRSKGLNESTVQKRFKNLKTFLSWSAKNGSPVPASALEFEPTFKIISSPVVFLSWSELMRFYSLEIPEQTEEFELTKKDGTIYQARTNSRKGLELAKDLFLFECFTGLRVSDIRAFRSADRKGDVLSVTTIKTGTPVLIELNDFSRSIIDKYMKPGESDATAFPKLPQSTFEKYIKQLGKLADISEPVTRTTYYNGRRIEVTKPKYSYFGTHTGRRTFICNALSKGIPPQIVMQWTGHRNYNSLKPYIAITDSARAEAMTLFNE